MKEQTTTNNLKWKREKKEKENEFKEKGSDLEKYRHSRRNDPP